MSSSPRLGEWYRIRYCHSTATSPAEGNGFTLLNYTQVKLRIAVSSLGFSFAMLTLLHVIQVLEAGRMNESLGKKTEVPRHNVVGDSRLLIVK